jgi:imidazolonepropionase-like amidohydrolase
MAEFVMAAVLIPGYGEPVEAGAVVFDAGGPITYAGPAASAPARAPEDRVTEVPVVLPGLWDCHAHFMGVDVLDLERFVVTDPLAAAATAVGDAAAVLDGGVTSVRDTGGMGLSLAAVVEAGRMRGPRIHAAGRILSMTAGHGDVHSAPLAVADCITGAHQFAILCDGVPEVLRAVRINLRRGAALVKVCASGGVISELDDPMHQQFSDEELAAIVGEAGRAGRIVAAHCHGKDGIMAALRAGCHTIEHGSYLDEEAADLMIATGAILVPTRFVVERLLRRMGELPAHVATKTEMIAGRHLEALKLAIAKGVPIAAGCDIFTSGQAYGENSSEIALLADAGLGDLGAIAAATANAPATLGRRAPRSGRLEAGFEADVIALTANPLDDRAVWGSPSNVSHVWKSGTRTK